MIVLKEISSKKDLKKFVKFQFELYKNNPYWIPPIINDEVESFNKETNPVFEHADARFFLAYNNSKIVGRIAAIINWKEVNDQKVKKMRFGWFDVVDDINVTQKLLEKINEIGKENNLDFIEGPVGFSNLDKVGLLTEGFDQLGTMITWYNPKYMYDHILKLNFKKEKGYLESYFDLKNVDADYYERLSAIVQKRLKVRPLEFSSTKDILPYVNEMFQLFNDSYSKLSSFVPISDRQIEYFKKKYISLIDPEFIKFIVDDNDKIIAFAITMPSFAEALRKANGKLFPFGFIHLLKAKKKNDSAIFYLIGIKPEYQKKGVTAIIFDIYFKTYTKKGITRAYRTPELEENKDIQELWKNFSPVTHKKRSTFVKKIE